MLLCVRLCVAQQCCIGSIHTMNGLTCTGTHTLLPFALGMIFKKEQSISKMIDFPNREVVITQLDLACFGGHARHILPPLSPSQPVIADGELTFSGSILRLFCCFYSFLVIFSWCLNLLLCCAHAKAQTKLRQPQCLRTASTAEQPAIGPARAAKHIQQYVRDDPRLTTQSSRLERASEVLPRANISQYFLRLFSPFLCCSLFTKPTTINWDYFYGPLTLSPVTGRRLDYILLLWNVSMTDVTKNSCLIAVTSSTC